MFVFNLCCSRDLLALDASCFSRSFLKGQGRIAGSRKRCRQYTKRTASSSIIQFATIDHHDDRKNAYCFSILEVKGHSITEKSLISRSSLIQTEPLRLKPSILFFLFFVLKVNAVCWHVSADYLVSSIACELSYTLWKIYFFKFEISNKKLLFDSTKTITFNIFDLFKWNFLLIQKKLILFRYDSFKICLPLWISMGVLCHVGVVLVLLSCQT